MIANAKIIHDQIKCVPFTCLYFVEIENTFGIMMLTIC